MRIKKPKMAPDIQPIASVGFFFGYAIETLKRSWSLSEFTCYPQKNLQSQRLIWLLLLAQLLRTLMKPSIGSRTPPSTLSRNMERNRSTMHCWCLASFQVARVTLAVLWFPNKTWSTSWTQSQGAPQVRHCLNRRLRFACIPALPHPQKYEKTSV